LIFKQMFLNCFDMTACAALSLFGRRTWLWNASRRSRKQRHAKQIALNSNIVLSSTVSDIIKATESDIETVKATKLQHGHGGIHWSCIVHLYVFDAEFQSDKSIFHY
jgi:hypothetical protein